MAGWYRRLELADDARRQDRAFVLSCVRREGLALRLAPAALRDDADLVAAAVAQDGLALRYASKALRGRRGVVLSAVARTGLALEFASLELRRDREVVLAAVREDGLALQHAGRDLRGDAGVVLAAVRQTGDALEHARGALRGDRDIVLEAVRTTGGALEFASDELRRDVGVCSAACRSDAEAVRLVDDPVVQRQVKCEMLRGWVDEARQAREEEMSSAEAAREERLETCERLLREQTQRREVADRKTDKKATASKDKAAEAIRAAWAEKVALGGRLYRMIEGLREENVPKIVQRGTLDLGDPWERRAEKRGPPQPEPELPQAPVVFQAGTGTQQRMVMSLVRQEVYSGPDEAIVRQHIGELVLKMTGADDVDMDTPLMESGIDSLASVDLRQQLQSDFSLTLPSTLMFNYPTMGGLATYLTDELTTNKVPGWGKVTVQEIMQEVPIMEQVPVEASAAPVAAASAVLAPAYQAPDPELVRVQILALVQNMTGSGDGDLDMDTPLMESGLDSIASVDLRQSLQREFTLDLPSTVMFNYPTMAGLTGYLVEQMEANEITWQPT